MGKGVLGAALALSLAANVIFFATGEKVTDERDSLRVQLKRERETTQLMMDEAVKQNEAAKLARRERDALQAQLEATR